MLQTFTLTHIMTQKYLKTHKYILENIHDNLQLCYTHLQYLSQKEKH